MARKDDGIVRHRGKLLTGRTAKRGREFSFAGPQAAEAFAAGVEEVREARPGRTRYPVSRELFHELKAATRVAERLEKRGCTISKDRAGTRAEVASAAPGTETAASAFAPFAPFATAAAPEAVTYPTPSTNFAGIATDWYPADCTMAAGPGHVLVAVNSSVAIYQKNGILALAPRTLSTWFGNVIQGATVFDPKALFDQHANRWVLVALAINRAAKDSWFLLSVSQSADPLGGWYNYALSATNEGGVKTNNWVDYPGLGVDSHAIYLTGNMFQFDGGFRYAKLRIVPKWGPYQGGAVTFKEFVRMKNADGTMVFTLQPCHTYGAPQAQYFVNSYFPTTTAPKNKLSLWTVTDPVGSPVLTLRTIETSPYNLPPDAVQKGGTAPLESGDVRVLNSVFRGGSIWCALNTQHNWGGNTNAAAIHWFQIEAGTGTLIQQGIYGARNSHYFYPALMPDNNGNMAMVFSRCGPSEYASLYFTGRSAADPLGQLQVSKLLLAGTAYYQKFDSNGKNRWGDYAGIASDPASPGLIWLYGQSAVPDNMWNTWVGSCF